VEEDVFLQVPIQEHGANIEDQVNDPMEEYVDANNTIEEYANISSPVGAQMEFKFHAMIAWTIHDALVLIHFCAML
jgi:hypothetical protein